ncbi:MAG: CDP-glucose 4,6-dehydratase [Fibrobacterota bacterium]|nr:CDP-glucose 4,6-dehydratase [Fibrobacterota bacterium]
MKSSSFWTGKRVFLTGHTGFKGGWLALWLHKLGAEVHGFALEPSTSDNLFKTAQVSKALASDTRADLGDYPALEKALTKAAPEIVLHLAAQALVRHSYREPLATLATNVMGTAQLLEASRSIDSIKGILAVTTDKCYENREWVFPYRENDALGGHDPYAASKACAEIVTASYRASFFDKQDAPAIATARAGNVIGGGDWAEDRLVPDCIRAFIEGRSVELRYPDAVRPWQHVLEPLSGYLMLAEALCGKASSGFREAWNFGPDASGDATVGEIARRVAAAWGAGKVVTPVIADHPHEAGQLRLDVTKARNRLLWSPHWSIGRALDETVSWYKAWHGGKDMHAFTLNQINTFSDGA